MYQIIYFYRVIFLNKTKQREFHTYLKTTIINSSPSSSSININIIIVHINKQPSSSLLWSFFLSFFYTYEFTLPITTQHANQREAEIAVLCGCYCSGKLDGIISFYPLSTLAEDLGQLCITLTQQRSPCFVGRTLGIKGNSIFLASGKSNLPVYKVVFSRGILHDILKTKYSLS